MVNSQEILNKVKAAKEQAPAGAFATEISSNADVVGNLNSKHMYNQTPEKNNGLEKEANKYLDKIASFQGLKSWSKRLLTNIKDAEPLTQIGVGAGTIIGLGKLKNIYDEERTKADQARLQQKSLQALNGLNKTLNSATLIKTSGQMPIGNLASKAMNNLGKSISTNKLAPSKLKVVRPKGLSNV